MLLNSCKPKKTCCLSSVTYDNNAVGSRHALNSNCELCLSYTKERARTQEGPGHLHCPDTVYLDIKEKTALLYSSVCIRPPCAKHFPCMLSLLDCAVCQNPHLQFTDDGTGSGQYQVTQKSH